MAGSDLVERLRDFETAIETMNCGLVAEDLDGKIVFANRRLLSWLDYEQEELVGQHLEVLVPKELRELIAEDLAASQDDDLRARLFAIRRKDSTTFPVVAIPQRLMGVTGELDGYFSVLVDLGAVLTAKPIGPVGPSDLRGPLSRIASELHAISLCVSGAGGSVPAIPLQHPLLRGLSERETEVLALLVAGARVPAIADRLHISPHTVRNHLKSMFRKLEVGSQSELIERVRAFAAGETPEASSAD